MVAKQRLFVRIGFVLGAIALGMFWLRAITAITEGRLFAYANYWNAPIGTITLIIVLAVLTPAWIWAVWRYWNWQGHKVVED